MNPPSKPRPIAATLVAVGIVLATAGQTQAAPLIDSTILKGDAVTGRTVELRVRASDPKAPVSGMVVGFGRGESGYGLSNCLPPDYRGRSFGPVAAPGKRVTLAAPHVYSTAGKRTLLANVTSAGCTGGQGSTLQTAEVEVVRPGTAPKPLVTLPPVTVPAGQIVPTLPGLGQLPAGGLNVQLPQVPGGLLPGIPAIPPVVIPPLPIVPPILRSTSAAACPGRGRWYRNTAAAERRASAALLCLLNRERKRRGLRPMRANRRLERAAKGHSRSMVRRRFFAHVGPGALNPAARLRSTRYLLGAGRWAIGENIGFGTGALTRPASIHSAWMHSTPHRAAMLSRRFREVGFGLYPGNPFFRKGATFTADFAATH